MSDILIARRYAKALSNTITDEAQLDVASLELNAFAEAYMTHNDLRIVLINPAVPVSDKLAIFEKLLALLNSETPVRQTIEVLYQRGRLPLIHILAKEFQYLVDERLKRVVGTLTSAISLSAEQEAEVTNSLSTYSGKRVQLETHINPDILGGIVVRMGDTIIDGSLRTRLAQLKQALLAEENGQYENSGH